jgi:cellulose synthase/poly-beta-1,6-N-acetylglucosamine synthase-like glycosyltransferase
MANPHISIVIPTRNEAGYIGTTLAQLEPLCEKYNLEIIVSDANSADGTADIVRAFAERAPARVHLVQSAGKQNIAIGCNLGAAQAKGEILFRMDADVRIPDPDRFFPKIIQKFENQSVVAATVPLWVYPEESGLADKAYHVFMNAVIRLSFTVGVYLAKGECQLVRRTAFEAVGGYTERLVAGEDCNLFYRLGKRGRIAYLYRLCVHHSPRRFRQYGYVRLSLIYLREGIWMLFGRRSYVKEWEVVR